MKTLRHKATNYYLEVMGFSPRGAWWQGPACHWVSMAFCPRANFLTWPPWGLSVLAASPWFVSTAPVVKEQPSPTPACPREGVHGLLFADISEKQGQKWDFQAWHLICTRVLVWAQRRPFSRLPLPGTPAPVNLGVLAPESAPGGALLPTVWPLGVHSNCGWLLSSQLLQCMGLFPQAAKALLGRLSGIQVFDVYKLAQWESYGQPAFKCIFL